MLKAMWCVSSHTLGNGVMGSQTWLAMGTGLLRIGGELVHWCKEFSWNQNHGAERVRELIIDKTSLSHYLSASGFVIGSIILSSKQCGSTMCLPTRAISDNHGST